MVIKKNYLKKPSVYRKFRARVNILRGTTQCSGQESIPAIITFFTDRFAKCDDANYYNRNVELNVSPYSHVTEFIEISCDKRVN